jgi:hypothetical protein
MEVLTSSNKKDIHRLAFLKSMSGREVVLS